MPSGGIRLITGVGLLLAAISLMLITISLPAAGLVGLVGLGVSIYGLLTS